MSMGNEPIFSNSGLVQWQIQRGGQWGCCLPTDLRFFVKSPFPT